MKLPLIPLILLVVLFGSVSTAGAQPWTNEITDTFFTPHAESAYRIFQAAPSKEQVKNKLPGNGWITIQSGDTTWLARPLAEGKWEAWSLLSETYDDQRTDYTWRQVSMKGKPCWLYIACDEFSHTAATHQNGNKSLRVQYWDLTGRPRLLLAAEETAIAMSSEYDEEGNLYKSQEGKVVRNRLEDGKRFTEVAVWLGDSVICHYETEWKSEPEGWRYVQLKNLPLPENTARLSSLFPAYCWPTCLYWFETDAWNGRH